MNTTVIYPAQVQNSALNIQEQVSNLVASVKKHVTVFRVYRFELKTARRLARLMDRHKTLCNVVYSAMTIWFLYYVLMYY